VTLILNAFCHLAEQQETREGWDWDWGCLSCTPHGTEPGPAWGFWLRTGWEFVFLEIFGNLEKDKKHIGKSER
jgi:N6-adenosine-specific RNA methylase IME4